MLFWTGSFLRLRITQPLPPPLPPPRPEICPNTHRHPLRFFPDFRCCYLPFRQPFIKVLENALNNTRPLRFHIRAPSRLSDMLCPEVGQLRHKTWYNVASGGWGGYASGVYAGGGRGGGGYEDEKVVFALSSPITGRFDGAGSTTPRPGTPTGKSKTSIELLKSSISIPQPLDGL